ncbi:replicative DNA helicase [Cupriavidus gilardii CR3]|uniref:Replicative DNA helicase n=1 Tax=Cupriavidus gilardii TaxID=82541 RepID=A0A6N1BHB5_9BURK|nr:replicative DNA helicase [Cupriavidus gilardii]ALD93484.1 replicative DNA helicase [Cupriavidus gilardii CR3]KAB0592799.1 replicative DNA helicase [Cupriavidus gilardii]MCT9017159.1 replicative DNA helicase [Cupriavidus gilardii]MCT9056822.1 replicative DNA helicase [Cupriavidus gilardii]NNH14293.1 replicative DNA helicase [Cupriavidus gilardii]
MSARDDFTVPHSVEAEQAVLGGLLLDNDAIDRVGDLQVDHFYRGDHRAIYAQIRELLATGTGADTITVYERLAAKGQAADCGGLGYLNELTLTTPSAANIGRYAAVVRDRAVKRSLLALANEVPAMVVGDAEARIVVDRVQAKLEQLSRERVKTEPIRASEGMADFCDLLTAQLEGKVQPLSTGFRDLDEKLGGGFRPGELVIVAGRPAMGKTAFALNIAANVARQSGSLVLSMEMPLAQLHQRNTAMLGRIPMARLRQPDLMTNEDWNNVTAAAARIADLSLFLDDQPALTLLEVRAKARAVKRKHGLALLIVDYLGLMTGGPSENRNQEVGSYSRGLKALAKELDITVLALAQLNRDLERRADKRPTMADLRDSGEIEQDADIICFLYRDEVYDPDSMAKGVCEVLIEKQRQGETGMVPLAYRGEFVLFSDLAYGFRMPEPKRQGRKFRDDM